MKNDFVCNPYDVGTYSLYIIGAIPVHSKYLASVNQRKEPFFTLATF